MSGHKRRRTRRKKKIIMSEGHLFLTITVAFVLVVGVVALSSDKASTYVENINLYKKSSSFHITADTFYITVANQGSGYVKNYTPEKTNNDFSGEIYQASKKYGVNANLIKAVIEAESNFNPKAISSKGAMGLMQLMPRTAERFNVTDPFNPSQNITGGTRYLKNLLVQFNNNKRLALAAYNAGEGAVIKYGAVPPYKETTFYVRKVLRNFQNLEENGYNNKQLSG